MWVHWAPEAALHDSEAELEKLKTLVLQRVRWSDSYEILSGQVAPDDVRILDAARMDDPKSFCESVADLRRDVSSFVLGPGYSSWLPWYVDRCCFMHWLRPDPVSRLNAFVEFATNCSRRWPLSSLALSCQYMFSGAMSVGKFYYGVPLMQVVDKLVRSRTKLGESVAFGTALIDFTDDPDLVDAYRTWAKKVDVSYSRHRYSATSQLNKTLTWSKDYGFPSHITYLSLEYPRPIQIMVVKTGRREWGSPRRRRVVARRRSWLRAKR